MPKIKAGGCCDCGGGVPCALQCRQKSGFADLCGFEAFVDPAVPPKLYRKRSYSGTMELRHFDAAPS